MVIKGGGGGGMLSSIGVLLSLAVRSKSACRCSNGSIWVTTSDKLPSLAEPEASGSAPRPQAVARPSRAPNL